jgi:hypothetical protein
MKSIVEVEIQKKINCSKDVIFWNYWDHEHLDVVHNNYKKSDVLYDKENFMFRVDNIQIPVFKFLKSITPIFMVQHDQNTLITFAVQFGILSKTKITVEEIDKEKSIITMNYKFELNGWKIILKPILKYLIPKWNENVWQEDLPLKLRRNKILKYNFKDFIGMPNNIADREIYNNKYNLKLPIPRPKNSSRDQHPFRKNK